MYSLFWKVTIEHVSSRNREAEGYLYGPLVDHEHEYLDQRLGKHEVVRGSC